MAKPRGIYAILARLPPVDWESVAATASRPFGKGSKHSRETLERLKKRRAEFEVRRRKERRRRQVEILKARDAARRVRSHAKRGRPTLKQQLVAAMAPGQWYAMPDLRELTGMAYGSVKGTLAVMRDDLGWVERARNPAAPAAGVEGYNPARGGVYLKGAGIEFQTKQQPVFLYRLTAKGCEARRLVLALG